MPQSNAGHDEGVESLDPGDLAVTHAHYVSEFSPLGAALPLGILGAVGMGSVVYVNEAAAEMIGRSEDELLGRAWESAIHSDDWPGLVEAIAYVVEASARQRVTVRLADDDERWLELTLASLGPPGRATGWLATVDEVSERVRDASELSHQATHDPLTRLPNRALLLDRLRSAGHRLERRATPQAVAVLFMDLEQFKAVNDSYGHAAGDIVLAEAARRLGGLVRSTDTVARYGGDEFVAVCEIAHAEEVDLLVERMSVALAEPIAIPGGWVTLGATIGVAVTTQPLAEIESLLDLADRDMYEQRAQRRRAG